MPITGRQAIKMGDKTSHLERTAREPRDTELLDVKLVNVQQINDRVRLLHLSLPAPIKVLAGQWLDTYIPKISGAGGFTITSAPSAASSSSDPYFELAVQKSPDNPHAAWLWRPVDEIVGEPLQVRVGGSFVYPPSEEELRDAKRVVLVAGGVGINPLVSMMGEMADRGDDLEIRVMYGSKFPRGPLRGVLFLERMAQMYRDGTLRGSMNVFLTNTSTSVDLRGEMNEGMHGASVHLHDGRMTLQHVKDVISGGNKDETLVYVCGPPTMTDELAAAVSGQKDGVIDIKRVITEKWW